MQVRLEPDEATGKPPAIQMQEEEVDAYAWLPRSTLASIIRMNEKDYLDGPGSPIVPQSFTAFERNSEGTVNEV